jgi:hypothetical protein
MSINVFKEFFIHYHCFRNIDLLNQGLYQIRSRIYYLDKTSKNFALPYFHCESKEAEENPKTDESTFRAHNIISSHLGKENQSEFITKSFLIRYSDEEVSNGNKIG